VRTRLRHKLRNRLHSLVVPDFMERLTRLIGGSVVSHQKIYSLLR
jgi:hypothetical protein